MKLILFKSADGWRWRLVGRNGRKLANSEAYSSKAKATQTAKRVSGAIGVPLR